MTYRNFNEFSNRSHHRRIGQKRHLVTTIIEGGAHFCHRQYAAVRRVYSNCATLEKLGQALAYEFDALRIIPIYIAGKIVFYCAAALSPEELTHVIELFEARWGIAYPGQIVRSLLPR